MFGDMCGLCGNHDGEPQSELVGPHRCFYNDTELFARAWTGSSDTCDLNALKELRKDVEVYQRENCRTIETLRQQRKNF